MSFFKELRDDLVQAVKELTSAGETEKLADDKHISRADVSNAVAGNTVSEEIPVIAPDITITGDIKSDSSVEITGVVKGNIECKGKLVITGKVTGNMSSTDFYANRADIKGDINCTGVAKVGIGTVIMGDLAAQAVVIAGAVKGDIFAEGPVIVDSTAVIRGDIRAKLIRVIDGAVIEGECLKFSVTQEASV